MKPELIYAEAWQALGVGVRTTNANESNPETAKIAPLWLRFFQEKTGEKISRRIAPNLLFGIYSDYESDRDGAYNLHVAGKVSADSPQDRMLERIDVPAGRYLVFHNRGTLPQVVFDTWNDIHRYFEENQDYQRAYGCDFEVYDLADDGRIEIHIAIKT